VQVSGVRNWSTDPSVCYLFVWPGVKSLRSNGTASTAFVVKNCASQLEVDQRCATLLSITTHLIAVLLLCIGLRITWCPKPKKMVKVGSVGCRILGLLSGQVGLLPVGEGSVGHIQQWQGLVTGSINVGFYFLVTVIQGEENAVGQFGPFGVMWPAQRSKHLRSRNQNSCCGPKQRIWSCAIYKKLEYISKFNPYHTTRLKWVF
jgi:hypothetical protein